MIIRRYKISAAQVLICSLGAALCGIGKSIAVEPPQIENGVNSTLNNQEQRTQHILPMEVQKEEKEISGESIQTRKEPESKGDDAADTGSENIVNKPLDLTFNPDFPDNPQWNDQFNTGGQGFQDLFNDRKDNSTLQLKGEFFRSFEAEDEKRKTIDGAGIRFELNPK